MIKFETKFNSDATKQLNSFTMKKIWWLYLLFTLLFVLLGTLNLIGDEPDLIFGIVMIAVGVAFTPACIGLTFLMQKKLNKTMSILSEDTVETYVFDEEKFSIKQEKGEDYKAITVAKYSYFNKVISTPTHYMLYLSASQCHVLPKSSLVEGSLEDLNRIFNANLHEKFISKNK